jgi:integrase
MGTLDGGKPDRRHVSAKARKAVVDKVRDLEAKRDAGVVLTTGAGAATLADWLDHWLPTIAATRIRQSTYDGYESKIKTHIKPSIGHHRLERLQPEHLEAFYAAKIAAGLAPGTVLVCHRILSRALKVAAQRGRVARNVAEMVEPPAATAAEVVPLTAAEARKVLAEAKDKRNAARWSVGLALGLRQAEVLGARWGEDVDLEAGVWRVRQQLRRNRYRHGCDGAPCGEEKPRTCPKRRGGLVASEPKTNRGRRTIGLPPQLLAELRAHRQAQLQERLKAGSTWQESNLVFAQVNGKPIDGKRDWLNWRDLLVEAGLRHTKVHDQRHTAASLLLAQGIPPRVVMEILGHSTIAVTMNIYAHVMPEAVTAATTAVADVLYAPTATTTAPKRPRRKSS